MIYDILMLTTAQPWTMSGSKMRSKPIRLFMAAYEN